MADKKIEDELEEFEAELAKDDDGEDLVEEKQVDLADDQKEKVTEDLDESGQQADLDTDEKPVEDDEADEKPDQTDDDDAPNLTTLPDDPETFGDLAGKQVTAKQLIDEGLLNKLVTWGHQGRHLIQKGQDDIAAAKAETSEAQKLRELLEKRFQDEDKKADADKPKVTEEQFASMLTENYLPGLKQVAAAGGIEEDFIKEFPRSASQIEHRFQAGSDLLDALIKEVGELREFVGIQRKANEETAQTDATTAAGDHFDGLMTDLATKGDLFEKLGDKDMRGDFMDWLTSDDTGLGISGKEVGKITTGDVQGAWLLYAHQHPEQFVKKSEKSEEDARLASGGGGNSTSTTRRRKSSDELSEFESEYKDSLANTEY